MADIPAGYGLIAGRGRDTARAALDAAAKAGVDPALVRTTADGYLVPEKVLTAYEAGQKRKPSTDAENRPEPVDTEPVETPAKKSRPASSKKE